MEVCRFVVAPGGEPFANRLVNLGQDRPAADSATCHFLKRARRAVLRPVVQALGGGHDSASAIPDALLSRLTPASAAGRVARRCRPPHAQCLGLPAPGRVLHCRGVRTRRVHHRDLGGGPASLVPSRPRSRALLSPPRSPGGRVRTAESLWARRAARDRSPTATRPRPLAVSPPRWRARGVELVPDGGADDPVGTRVRLPRLARVRRAGAKHGHRESGTVERTAQVPVSGGSTAEFLTAITLPGRVAGRWGASGVRRAAKPVARPGCHLELPQPRPLRRRGSEPTPGFKMVSRAGRACVPGACRPRRCSAGPGGRRKRPVASARYRCRASPRPPSPLCRALCRSQYAELPSATRV
jgi:hypothetical protein